jgi:hypothetical protein
MSRISTGCGCKKKPWVPPFFTVLVLLAVLDVCDAAEPIGHTPIAEENARPGDASWVLTDPADHEIEGYASATSVNRGESLRFFVNTADPTFSLSIYRMGWYGGAGARLVKGSIELPAVQQSIPIADPETGFIECNWQTSYTLHTTPTEAGDWLSGVYLAKLTARPSGKQSYIIFVVREDDRPSDFLFQSSVTTYQAYNNWGGRSTYPSNSLGEQWARKVSFNRPYARSQHPDGWNGTGAGDFLTATSIHPTVPVSPAGWEYNMLRWLEREGYDVTYNTDLDTHRNPHFYKGRKAWLSVGHDEYWSSEMRRHVEAARDHGVGLGFFSSNTCYWQIRLEPSPVTGEPDRTMVAYKEMALLEDPYALDGDDSNDRFITVQWREQPVDRPEHRLLGVMTQTFPVDGDVLITSPLHPIFISVPLQPDRRLPGLLGYEIDRTFANGPSGLMTLAHSPIFHGGETRYGDMTIYQSSSGAWVYATGTMQWSWGLDDYNVPAVRTSRLNSAAQQITRNVLSLLASRPSTPAP